MTLPAELTEILSRETALAWEHIAPILPRGCRLAGGTALAVHLRHRQSHDLDFFYKDPSLDLAALEQRLSELGSFAVSSRAPGTLNGILQGAKLQFLDAHDQIDLDEPEPHAGIPVSSLADVFAMKIKVIGDRGELRDYFDLKRIEELTGRRIEEGIGLYMTRYQIPPEHPNIGHIVEALGYLDDVDEDEMLPEDHATITAYWTRRQPEISRSLARFPDA
ncbi:MAG TPA: nucleotidyl transferase AbiEii/AbiGii toxin family protein [Solirubrobacteraceae bacterium]